MIENLKKVLDIGATPYFIIGVEGRDVVGYTVKWVNDNLGITRDMIRYYEKENLIPKNINGGYRYFSNEDIDRIWGIKLLIGIGFSTKEIHSIMNDATYDFDMAIAQKVKELEQKRDENLMYLNFAKSIKFTGRVPTVKTIGSIKFEEFLHYAHENWNFYDDPRFEPFMQISDALISKEPREWNSEDMECMKSIFEDAETMMRSFALHGYYQVISDMREFEYSSEMVQRVVAMLHKYLVEHSTEPELDGKITPQFFAKYMAPLFIGGDISILNIRNYGEDGCLFIAKALAYYGGFDIENL